MFITVLRKACRSNSYYRKQWVQCRPNTIFGLVSRTEQYHSFLPWCTRSSIINSISPSENHTELIITFNEFKSISYISHVTIAENESLYRVTSRSEGSPLKKLESTWTILKSLAGEDQRKAQVEYSVRFEFNSIVYDLMSRAFMGYVGEALWNTFVERAKQLDCNRVTSEDSSCPQQLSSMKTLQEYLSKRIELRQQYVKSTILRDQIRKISQKLQGTQHYEQKMDFQVGNLLVHFNNNPL